MKRAKKYPFLSLQRQRFHLNFDNASSADSVPSEHDFYRWAFAALKDKYRHAEISLILLDEEEARAYNRDYRGKDYATNVLSFALNEGEIMPHQFSDGLYGDLIICPQVVLKEAKEQGKTPEQHFAHLTMHGTLHLMGYDHIEDHEAELMEATEIRLMQAAGYPNPYQEDEH
ncbi:rRNA maturation RNase YbeY [Neisseria sp. N95_16]|uniref:Endoribonuclease YbeY n=1 Tax=Neisseria brasiliensis TaxID=2666100 RepID=A0A5Q3S120_9NEIS|nr:MULTISPECIES: rRNA maturation RNase YbeY [Neisseria]MRN37506.1 rRNA maturation RNase YbeY [Neisseria brasiliensis]PJO08614.1 rRNA maturation RNase YbeY [Neisseria sp. N95_16]PJO79363.1 rRNA maturation RNase YbeY [Neisseria sp. N177_16]QGL24498.1 rRNA maturation RNase YbeY [Neisseria brasiliensis]